MRRRCTDLDVEGAGEYFVLELVVVERGARPDDLVGLHPPELKPVVLVVAGTLQYGRVAGGHLDDGVLDFRRLAVVRDRGFDHDGRQAGAPGDRRRRRHRRQQSGARAELHFGYRRCGATLLRCIYRGRFSNREINNLRQNNTVYTV